MAFAWLPGVWDADQDEAKFYLENGNTVVVPVRSEPEWQAPRSRSTSVYQRGTRKKTEHRDAEGNVDSTQIGPMTFKRCKLPTDVWKFDERSSTYDGAKRSLNAKTSMRRWCSASSSPP
jgi:hypothetical protein